MSKRVAGHFVELLKESVKDERSSPAEGPQASCPPAFERRSSRNLSGVEDGGLKGRLHGRKPRSSHSPDLRRGRQSAHQTKCGRTASPRGLHPLSWAEGP